jgi:hypothetical protein
MPGGNVPVFVLENTCSRNAVNQKGLELIVSFLEISTPEDTPQRKTVCRGRIAALLLCFSVYLATKWTSNHPADHNAHDLKVLTRWLLTILNVRVAHESAAVIFGRRKTTRNPRISRCDLVA